MFFRLQWSNSTDPLIRLFSGSVWNTIVNLGFSSFNCPSVSNFWKNRVFARLSTPERASLHFPYRSRGSPRWRYFAVKPKILRSWRQFSLSIILINMFEFQRIRSLRVFFFFVNLCKAHTLFSSNERK